MPTSSNPISNDLPVPNITITFRTNLSNFLLIFQQSLHSPINMQSTISIPQHWDYPRFALE
ncbi:MAG: hypothetical protein KME55_36540, partial [Nostoc indistinguendum CM1-VF10]|nr:hypothetical protein [Nostoc indistinguendum CM1-VF10]